MFVCLSQTLAWCCQALRQRVVCLRVSLLCRQASATAPASPRLSPDRLHTHPIRCQVSLKHRKISSVFYILAGSGDRKMILPSSVLWHGSDRKRVKWLVSHFFLFTVVYNSSSSLCPKVPVSLLPQASTPPTTQCPTPPTTLPHSRYLSVCVLLVWKLAAGTTKRRLV